MLRIEEVKIKGNYLELPFGTETSYVAGHAFLPLRGYIKTIILYDSIYQIISKEMDVNDMYLIPAEKLKVKTPLRITV